MENIKISQTQIFICYHCRLCCCSKMEIHWKNNCGVGQLSIILVVKLRQVN